MYNTIRVGDSFVERRVAFVSRKNKSKAKIAAPKSVRVQRLALFGPPLLLEGEDAAAYDELLARICAAVKPVDIIDEMFIADVVSLEWEVLRWRRLKSNLIRARGLKALENFLVRKARIRSVRGTLCCRSSGNSSGQSSGRPGGLCRDAGVQSVPGMKRTLSTRSIRLPPPASA